MACLKEQIEKVILLVEAGASVELRDIVSLPAQFTLTLSLCLSLSVSLSLSRLEKLQSV
jgi:hypothetical protein